MPFNTIIYWSLFFIFSRISQILADPSASECENVQLLLWKEYQPKSLTSYNEIPIPIFNTTKEDLTSSTTGTVYITIITHGFSSSCIEDLGAFSMLRNAEAFSKANSNANKNGIVICANWTKLAYPSSFTDPVNLLSNYIKAANNTDLVGQCIGEFINSVIELNNLNSGLAFVFEVLLGISLGAHVMGSAGNSVPGEVELIIGLDPAGPLYGLPSVVIPPFTFPFHSLEKTDAIFVLIVHTSVPLGIISLLCGMGDVEFFVNNGVTQKYCLKSPTSTPCTRELLYPNALLPGEQIIEQIFCSHAMSIVYMNYAIVSGADPLSSLPGYYGFRCNLPTIPTNILCYLGFFYGNNALIMGPETPDEITPGYLGPRGVCTATCPVQFPQDGILGFSLGKNYNKWKCLIENYIPI